MTVYIASDETRWVFEYDPKGRGINWHAYNEDGETISVRDKDDLPELIEEHVQGA